jgi:hypothetical protein
MTATAAVTVQPVARPPMVSSRAIAVGLMVFCAALCALRWGKLDTLWGDSARWIFEAYRTGLGEYPYRDFTWQYPPLSILLSGLTLSVVGAKFAALQGLLDIIGVSLVLLTWDTARRFVPGLLAVSAAIVLACAGVANAANFALFSLQIYTPAILLGGIGLLLVIREMADYLTSGSMTRTKLGWTIVGSTIGLLSKPEFIIGVLGCLVTAALLDRRIWFPSGARAGWAWRHGRVFLLATAPAIAAYAAIVALCGAHSVFSAIGGYGTAALTCPWWPTGLGVFGALVAVGYGVIAVAVCCLLQFRRSWARYGKMNILLWGGALLSAAAAVAYLPYCVAELPVFSGGATPFRIVSFFLSTGTVLLPVMWIGILLWVALIVGIARMPERRRTEHSLLMLLLTPAFLISLRGLFGGTMSQLTQVSMAAYPLWMIVCPYLMLWFLRKFEFSRHPALAISAILLAYGALRLMGAVVTEATTQYARLDTDAGTIRLRDTQVAPKVFAYVMTHTDRGEPLLDVADGGGVNFGGHRASPIFSTQFTAFAPDANHLNTDLVRIEKNPPRLVIANAGADFQATYGLCMNTGCTFPALVWRSSRLACDPSRTFPVLEYIRSHYQQVARFGEKVIYARKAAGE